jgi:hypothetical protein
MATASASGRTEVGVAVEAEAAVGEVVDPFSTAAVRIRKEILGVRNISKLRASTLLRISN